MTTRPANIPREDAGREGTGRDDDVREQLPWIGGDTTPPVILSFGVTNPQSQDAKVTVKTGEQLGGDPGDIAVPLDLDGTLQVTLGRTDFSETSLSGGNYQYEATYNVGSDGNVQATLNTAKDAAGNDGASGESATVTVSSSSLTTNNVLGATSRDRGALLMWPHLDGATGWTLERSTDGGSTWNDLANEQYDGTSREYYDTNATNGQSTMYRVTPQGISGSSVTQTVTPSKPDTNLGSYPLDEVAGARGGWSFRLLRSSYSGPLIRIERLSDNTQADVMPDGDLITYDSIVTNRDDGGSDTDLYSFLGNDDARLHTMYGQSSNANDLTPTTSTLPKFAVNGVLVKDNDGNIGARFHDDTLEASVGSFDHNNVTTSLVMGVVTNDDSPKADFANFGDFQVTAARVDGTNTPINTNGWYTTNQRVVSEASDGTVTLSLAQRQIGSDTGTNPNGSRSSVVIGDVADVRFHECVFYPYQSDETSLASAVAGGWKDVGAPSPDSNAVLPQAEQHDQTMREWMKTLGTSDVSVSTLDPLSWGGTYADKDELARLYMEIGRHEEFNNPQNLSQDKWYVLDDGTGEGIEDTTVDPSVVRFPNESGGESSERHRSFAKWLDVDIPLSDGSQGNDWYQDGNIARRCLTVTLAGMMMWWKTRFGPSFWDHYGFAASWKGWGEVWYKSKFVLPSDVQSAMETYFHKAIDYMQFVGLKDELNNMNAKLILGCAYVYLASEDSTLKARAVDMARTWMYGGEENEIDDAVARGNDSIFRREGFIDENESWDPSYAGRALTDITLAGALTYGKGEWEFLTSVLQRFSEMFQYQWARDGDGQLIGPAGMNGRTSDGAASTQSVGKITNIPLAGMIPRARGYVDKQGGLPGVSEMQNQINTRINDFNPSRVTQTPNVFDTHEAWPAESSLDPRKDGWYADLEADVNNNIEAVEVPVDRSSDWIFSTPYDFFWSGKQTASANGREFGFMVEAAPDPGGYGANSGGKLEAFWTDRPNAGGNPQVLICTGRLNKNWAGDLDFRPIGGTYGLDTNTGNKWWTSIENSNNPDNLPPRTVSKTTDGNGNVDSYTVTTDQTDQCRVNSGSWSGTLTTENKFELTSNGLQLSTTLTYSGSGDKVTQLWRVLPLFVRFPGQSIDTETKVEYWNSGNSVWRRLKENGAIASARWLRIYRDWGSGREPMWVDLGQSRDVRRTVVREQTYQRNKFWSHVRVNMHPNRGVQEDLSSIAPVSLTFDITLEDPGYTGVAMSATSDSMTDNATYVESESVGEVMSVDWADTTKGTLRLQASTDNGSTWTNLAKSTWNGSSWDVNQGYLQIRDSGTPKKYQIVGDSLPSGVTDLRVQAETDSGQKSGESVSVSGQQAASTLAVEDTYTDSDGTTLNNHTTTTGGLSWQGGGASDMDIQNDELTGAFQKFAYVSMASTPTVQVVEVTANNNGNSNSSAQGIAHFRGSYPTIYGFSSTTFKIQGQNGSSIAEFDLGLTNGNDYTLRLIKTNGVVEVLDSNNNVVEKLAIWTDLTNDSTHQEMGINALGSDNIFDDFRIYTE